MSTIPKSLYPKFFAAMRAAAMAQGFKTPDGIDAYYRRVLFEEAQCRSIKEIRSLLDFDKCLSRFSAESGTFQTDYNLEQQKRRAFVLKVMCCQIVAINGFGYEYARPYFEGIFNRSGLASYHSDGEDFYLDVSAKSVLTVVKMLDTHLRRLKRRFVPNRPLKFNSCERFFVRFDGSVCVDSCSKFYYSNIPFSVRFSTP